MGNVCLNTFKGHYAMIALRDKVDTIMKKECR